jgi:hypothetical protein
MRLPQFALRGVSIFLIINYLEVLAEQIFNNLFFDPTKRFCKFVAETPGHALQDETAKAPNSLQSAGQDTDPGLAMWGMPAVGLEPLPSSGYRTRSPTGQHPVWSSTWAGFQSFQRLGV